MSEPCDVCGRWICTTKPAGHWDGKCSIDEDGNIGECHGYHKQPRKGYEETFAENHPDGKCSADLLLKYVKVVR